MNNYKSKSINLGKINQAELASIKKGKHIAIVLNTSWNVYNFRLNLLKKLQQYGYNITVIAPQDAYSKKLEAEGFQYIDLKMNNDGTNVFEEFKLIVHFFKIYKVTHPDIILQYTIKPNIYGTFVASLLKIPVINNISGLGTIFLQDKMVYKFARFLYKGILRFPKKVFFQNKYDHERFLNEKLVKSENSETIPGSGIDVNRFMPIKHEKEEGSVFYFLMIARLIKDKGVVEYIEAIKIVKKKYPKVKFQLIGALYLNNPTAIREEELTSWIEDDLIEYLGVSDNIEEVISQVDCVVLPSYREGLSRVLLEAASMEKPIITTDVPGCKDVVDHGVNGFLCEVKSSQSLAKRMMDMLSISSKSRDIMGTKSREKVIRQFNEDILIDKYLETIKEVLK